MKLKEYAIIISNGLIDSIIPQEELSNININDFDIIDCSNRYIMPGLIDLHSDVIENIIVPRKGVIFDVGLALHEIDHQLICQGITTMYHSISIANSTICNRKRTLSVEQMIEIGDSISKYDTELLVNHRFHARFELNTLEAFDDIYSRMEKDVIHEFSFMNHTPGQGQYTSLETFKIEIKKQYGDISNSQISQIISECQNKPLLTEDKIEKLIKLAKGDLFAY